MPYDNGARVFKYAPLAVMAHEILLDEYPDGLRLELFKQYVLEDAWNRVSEAGWGGCPDPYEMVRLMEFGGLVVIERPDYQRHLRAGQVPEDVIHAVTGNAAVVEADTIGDAYSAGFEVGKTVGYEAGFERAHDIVDETLQAILPGFITLHDQLQPETFKASPAQLRLAAGFATSTEESGVTKAVAAINEDWYGTSGFVLEYDEGTVTLVREKSLDDGEFDVELNFDNAEFALPDFD